MSVCKGRKFRRLPAPVWPYLLISGLFACSTAPISPAPELQKSDTPKYGPQISALSERRIPAGQCGLILWSAQGNEVIPVFRAIKGEAAVMIVDGAPVELGLASQKGTMLYGFAETSVYRTGDVARNVGRRGDGSRNAGIATTGAADTGASRNGETLGKVFTAEIRSPFGLEFEGGVYIEEGSVNLRDGEGWERIFPVAGIAGCA